jgi:hypothetical protein
MDTNKINKSQKKPQNLNQTEEVVEFHSEMPEVRDENLEFVPDQKLEDKIQDQDQAQ